MNRYLVSVTTPNYVGRAVRYFQSLPLIRSATPVVILLDFRPETDPDGAVEHSLRSQLDWVEFRHMALPPHHSFGMIQHAFMDALSEAWADDLILLSDMDVKFQRDLDPEEWAALEEGTADGRLTAYYNVFSTDTLEQEAERIGLAPEWVAANCPEDVSTVPCRNCGLMAGRASAFLRLQGHYLRLCESFYQATAHRSRCQWLINWCVHRFMGGFRTMPDTVHAHAHIRDPEGRVVPLTPHHHYRLSTLCWKGVPVVAKHNFPEDAE